MEPMQAEEELGEGLRVPEAHERVLQITHDTPRQATATTVHLLLAGACELLHIPPPVLAVLRAHQRDEHTERHFATHVAGFRRAHGSHLLINAHPLFGDAAFAAGEPPWDPRPWDPTPDPMGPHPKPPSC